MRIVAVVLAAGESRRMGTDKLALRVGGFTVLEAAILPFVESTRIDEVIVVRRPGQSIPATLAACRVVEATEHLEGMGASLRAGVAAAHADWWVLSLGDLPGMSMHTIERVLDAMGDHPDRIIVPTHQGRRGHPVAIPASFREELLAVRGDSGARGLIERAGDAVLMLTIEDVGSFEDVDVPEDLRRAAGQGTDTQAR